ncbi:MAG: hypothetical protein ABJY83_15015 [Roseibium sp.]
MPVSRLLATVLFVLLFSGPANAACIGTICDPFSNGPDARMAVPYVVAASNDPLPTQFVYRVSGGHGTVAMLGVSQPAPVEENAKVVFTPKGDVMILTLPKEFESPPVELHRVGNKSFSGIMPSWSGFPIKVEVLAEDVSTSTASIEFFADNGQIKMDMTVNLTLSDAG